MCFGLLFSIISVLVVVPNVFMVGVLFGFDPLFGVLSILPHGIIEYLGYLLSLAGSFMITKCVIDLLKGIFSKKYTVKGVLTESKIHYKDILLTIVFIIILLYITQCVLLLIMVFSYLYLYIIN